MDLAYNAVLLAIDIWFLRVANPLGARRLAIGASVFGLVASILALALARDLFGVMRLLCYAIFVHGVAISAVLGIRGWKSSPVIASSMLFVSAAVALVGVDAFLIEPRDLEVSHVPVVSGRLEKPLRIVVLADVQTDGVGAYEKKAFVTALQQKPDIVLFAGDYVQVAQTHLDRHRLALRALMKEVGMAAPLGVYAVQGNVDPPGWETIFEGLPVVTFGDTRDIDIGELRVTGLSEEDSFDSSLRVPATERFHIVLWHAPDFALGDVQADLLVAGHTHGGQVRLPWVGPLITFSSVPRSWAAGTTVLSQGRTLVVSRGVGLERDEAPRLRFLCHPEILVIDVQPDATHVDERTRPTAR